MAWSRTSDGSIEDQNDRVIHFSTERFVRDIALGDCCFICGAQRKAKEFNDEHILPHWLLKEFGLFNRKLVLPNGSTYRYGSYTVPCCFECNSFLGSVIESPTSKLLKLSSEEISQAIREGAGHSLFIWMALVFFKMHLKDRLLLMNQDLRSNPKQYIAEALNYDWSELHHLHCIVRAPYSGAIIAPEAFGSFLAYPVHTNITSEGFDLSDSTRGQALLLRFNDLALYSIFNDSGGSLSRFNPTLQKLGAPLEALQMREVLAHLAAINIHIRNRPVFWTEFDLDREQSWICGKHDDTVKLYEFDRTILGGLLHRMACDYLDIIRSPNMNRQDIEKAMREGHFSFLFDEAGQFIDSAKVASLVASGQH